MNVKKNIKFIGIVIALSFSALLGLFLHRGRNGGDGDSFGDLGKSIDSARDNNKQSGAAIEAAQDSSADIRKDNKRAITGIRTVKEILKAARERANSKTD